MSGHSFPTPALVIDRSRLEANVTRMAAAMEAAGIALRPHFKTSKLIEVARLQSAAGAVGFTCSTPEEVEALIGAGFTDLFWAHAPVGAKAAIAAEFNTRARVAVGVDSFELAEPLSAAAIALGVVVPVLLEIDTGLGRTGVEASGALEVARAISALQGVRIDGVYMHEGQLAGLGGTREELRAAGRDAAATLVAVAGQLREAGIPIAIVSVGSTPGWDSAPLVDGVTEARPGTYVFSDANQLRLESTTLENTAITVLASVVSTQRPGAVIIDAGIKAMSSDGSNRGRTFGLALAADGQLDTGLEFAVAYEEHGRLDGAHTFRVGDTVRILPNHACGVVNMWSFVKVIDSSGAVETWSPVARH